MAAGLAPKLGLAQSSVHEFRLGGSAAIVSEDCIRLTPDEPHVSGSAWFEEPVHLGRRFEVRLSLVFGTKDEDGADGMVFVLHPTPDTGWRGEGMGFAGLVPSLGVEFDTYQNDHLGDPAADHVALMKNGRRAHGIGLGNPVSLGDVEDGRRHELRVAWDPAAGRLEVFFDGSLRATAPRSVLEGLFGPEARLYWGVTGGTGRLSNAQDICIEAQLLSRVSPPTRRSRGRYRRPRMASPADLSFPEAESLRSPPFSRAALGPAIVDCRSAV